MDSKAAASTPATDVDVGKEENQPESSQSVKRAEMVRTTQSTQSSIGGVSTRESSDEEVPATETSIAPAKRTPFTSLTQVDADMALARALQEQVFLCLSVKTLSTLGCPCVFGGALNTHGDGCLYIKLWPSFGFVYLYMFIEHPLLGAEVNG